MKKFIVLILALNMYLGVSDKFTPEDTVNFGVASSAITHTLHGDGNITDDISLIEHIMQMNFDIKRQEGNERNELYRR